jgi:hypothetical protein
MSKKKSNPKPPDVKFRPIQPPQPPPIYMNKANYFPISTEEYNAGRNLINAITDFSEYDGVGAYSEALYQILRYLIILYGNPKIKGPQGVLKNK